MLTASSHNNRAIFHSPEEVLTKFIKIETGSLAIPDILGNEIMQEHKNKIMLATK